MKKSQQMLLSFTVGNFRSFREEQTLSMIASNRHPDHSDHLAAIPNDDNRVLPVVAVYGANGAGKSNWVHALRFLQTLVVRGTEPKKPIARRAFALDKESPQKPTEFQIQFVEGNHAFAFGCQVSDLHVDTEWLSLLSDGKESRIYERATDATGMVTINAGEVLTKDPTDGHLKIRALMEVGVLPNQLFLHAIGAYLREQDQGPIVGNALRWFTDHLSIVSADSMVSSLAQLISRDEAFTRFSGDFLRRVATGVDRLRVESDEVEERLLATLGPDIEKVAEGLEMGESATSILSDGEELLVEKGPGTKVLLRTIRSEHLTPDGTRIVLPFSEESDGTRRLTHLLPALHALRNAPGLVVVDEIDRSLHPLLAKGFVRTFLQLCAGKGSQLIFTTHDTTFLDLELLRRDEIWFVNKHPQVGATELYSLADYKVRTDLKIDKAYLQGRFEAVPPVETELPDWVTNIIQELGPRPTPKKAAV